MKDLHCHVQLEYCAPGTDHAGIESLLGFDPTKNRELVHKMLDEYLDVWVERLSQNPNATELEYKENGFQIFSYANR